MEINKKTLRNLKDNAPDMVGRTFNDVWLDVVLSLIEASDKKKVINDFLEWFDKPEKLLDHNELINEYLDE